MNLKSVLHHIDSLETEYKELSQQIKEGRSSFLNDGDLSKAKYQRILIKREIDTLKHQYNQTRTKH